MSQSKTSGGLFADIPDQAPLKRILFPVPQVLIVLAVAVALRILYRQLAADSVFFSAPVVDASFFDNWARTLAEGKVFQAQAFFKPPLYAYLLSFFYRLGLSLAVVQVLQMIVGSLTAVLTLAVGRLAFTPRQAFAGALVTALLPVLPFFEGQLLAETWTTALATAALLPVLLCVTGRVKHLDRALAATGLLLGIAALGRPNLMLAAVVLVVWLWRWGRSTGRLKLTGMAPLVVGFLIAVAPVTIHNLAHGEFVLISANGGVNLVAGNSDQADGISAVPVGVRWDDLQQRARQAHAADPGASSRFFAGRAAAWIGENPGRFLQLMGKKLLLLVNAQEGRNNIHPRWLAQNDGVFLLSRWWPGKWLLLPFALLGLAVAGRGVAPVSLLRWLLLSQAAAVLPFFVNARFRAPLLPTAALFAVAAVAVLWSWRTIDRRRLGLGLAALLAAFVVVNIDWFDLGNVRWLARDHYNRAMLAQRPAGMTPAGTARLAAQFEQAIALNPEDPDFHENYGVLLLQAARPRVDEAANLARNERWADTVAPVAAAEDLLNRAEQQHATAARLFPRSFRSWTNQGLCRLWRGDGEAVTAGRLLAAGDDEAARARSLEALRHYQQAVDSLRKALTIDSGLRGARSALDQVWASVMRLPDLDPRIADVQDALRRGQFVRDDAGAGQ